MQHCSSYLSEGVLSRLVNLDCFFFVREFHRGAQTFFRSNVLENEQLHSRVKDVGDSVKDTAAEWSETASGAWSSLRQKVTEKEVVTNVTGNVL
eukprot:5201201-Amphidinium_carterae.2